MLTSMPGVPFLVADEDYLRRPERNPKIPVITNSAIAMRASQSRPLTAKPTTPRPNQTMSRMMISGIMTPLFPRPTVMKHVQSGGSARESLAAELRLLSPMQWQIVRAADRPSRVSMFRRVGHERSAVSSEWFRSRSRSDSASASDGGRDSRWPACSAARWKSSVASRSV